MGTLATSGLVHSAVRELERRAAASDCLTAVRHFPARPARWAGFPQWLDARLAEALRRRGIERLFSHQAAALEAVQSGRDVVVVTPTASGKRSAITARAEPAAGRSWRARPLPVSHQSAVARSDGGVKRHY